MPLIANDRAVEHQPTKVEYSVIQAPERIHHSAVQGPPALVRCACGTVIRWEDEGNFYESVEEHFGSAVAARL